MLFKQSLDNKLIKKINESLKKCDVCKNRNTRGGNFLTEENYPPDVFFIAQNPGSSNYNKKIEPEDICPFGLIRDEYYHKFFDYFYKCFFEFYGRYPGFYVTNIIKCCTADNTVTDEEMIRNCIEKYLKIEIKYFNKANKNIKFVTLGKVANASIQNYLHELKYINLWHPGYLNRMDGYTFKTYVTNFVKQLGEI